jgi:PAS domain S-box-containing protein
MADPSPNLPAVDASQEVLEERIGQLEKMKSFQDELVRIVRAFTSNEAFTSERCLQEIVGFIAGKLDFYEVAVLLVDEISRELVLFVSGGAEPPSSELKSFRVPLGSGITGHCALTGETCVANDVSRDARYIRGPFEKTQSEMCVPIRIKQRIVGVLDLQDCRRDRFRKDFTQVMEDLSLSLGFVLETKQLHEDLKRYNEQLEKTVEEKIRELKHSEERYRAIVENAADPIFMTDPQGHFTWVNRAACNHLGYLRNEMIGLNLSRVVKKGHMHKLYLALRDCLEGREVKPIQIEVMTKICEERTVEFACSGVRENGRATGVEATLRDITDRVVIDKLKKNYMKSLEEAVVERTSEIKETQRAAILAIANLAESIDDDTGGHLQRIRSYSKVLADELRQHSRYKDSITEEYSEMIYDLSPLHDLGKVGIRDYILQKPDKLTSEEFEKMKDHAEIGARALRMAGEMIHRESIFSIGEMIARFHHEKWDGSGYPAVEINGETRPLRGEEIPLCARIVALADVYDALTSKRPYKMPFPHERAREMIVSQGGKHFDPEVVEAFLSREQEFVSIRAQFPDTHIPEGRPFELPARDRA